MLGRNLGRFDRGLARRCIAVARRVGRITQAPDGPVPAIGVGQLLRDQLIARAISPGNCGREQRFIHFRPFVRSTACVDCLPRRDHHRVGLDVTPRRRSSPPPETRPACASTSVSTMWMDQVSDWCPSRLRHALVYQETHHGIAQRLAQLFGRHCHGNRAWPHPRRPARLAA